MRFACLVYFDPKVAFDGSPANNAILGEAEGARQRMFARGFHAEALTLPNDAVTVRIRGGKVSRTDGPFMETKEVLGGIVIVDVESLEEAIAIAADNPMAKFGSVEVRPMVDFSKPRPQM